MKKIAYILTIISFLSSCSKTEEKDVDGYWISFSSYEIPFHNVYFDNDSCFITDYYDFNEKGIFSIEKNNLKITTNNNREIETEIKQFSSDSILLFDSITFYKRENLFRQTNTNYELIGVKTDQTINPFHIPSTWAILHLLKNDSIRLRLGDKYSPSKEIPSFLRQGHYSIRNCIVFIGKDVKLEDYQNVIFHLAAININKVMLVVNKNLNWEYEVIQDRYHFGWEEMKSFLKKNKMPLPPPPPSNDVSKIPIATSQNELFHINTINDYLDWKSKVKNYSPLQTLIVNKHLKMEYYIYIKNDLQHFQFWREVDV